MSHWRIRNFSCWLCLLISLAPGVAMASEYRGQVIFGGLPVPGATVSIFQADQKLTTVTDLQGLYHFSNLANGRWTIDIEMFCFAPIREEIAIGAKMPVATWTLRLLSLQEIRAAIHPVLSLPSAPSEIKNDSASSASGNTTVTLPADLVDQASDGLLINGSVNNAATSQYALTQAFGNNRTSGKGLYNFGLGVTFSNSALNASPYAWTGVSSPKPEQNLIAGTLMGGGPVRIPHLISDGPTAVILYQWTQSSSGQIIPGLFPTEAERDGDLSQLVGPNGQPIQFINPATGLPYKNGRVPVSPQAKALLNLYPLPNILGSLPSYNYQIPILNNTHRDAVQLRLAKELGENQFYGNFGFLSTHSDTPNLFDFVDTSNALGLTVGLNWSRTLRHRMRVTLGYRFGKLSTHSIPYWENRENISGNAGITGNNQDPMNWGPPTLRFNSGVSGLSDGSSAFNRTETNSISPSWMWVHGRHYVQAGVDFRRSEFNYLSQSNPRGIFTFTGAATAGTVDGVTVGGSDVADFLLGIPDTSAVAFGNADKYLRGSVYDIYATDDWRISPQLTANIGARWEYNAPITELKNRLVNLDVTSDFTAVTPVLAASPVGALTGIRYPSSLVRPVKNRIEPRIGVAWRPLAGSTMVLRAGYGITSDTSVYETIALSMAQQAPLSKSLNVQNSSACPLTLADGFIPCSEVVSTGFAIDPHFRTGYAQTWQLSVQRDLPFALQATMTYQGIKGTRSMQEFYPNTYPVGAINPCPACPSGFVYAASNGNSTREAGSIQLRRRMRSGFTASLLYTYSKSIDDSALLGGQGPVTTTSASGANVTQAAVSTAASVHAQNWLDLKAERGLSSFDQRHLLNVTLQYTTGMGLGGRTLMTGWRGRLFKEWTLLTTIMTGTGLPQTPIYPEVVPGTGNNNSIRPDYTGASVHATSAGRHLNPAAFAAPASGQWGNARKNSITGPNQLMMNASIGRTFRLKDRYSMDAQISSLNPLNHPTFANWVTVVGNSQFGLPQSANAMRSVQINLRLRY